MYKENKVIDKETGEILSQSIETTKYIKGEEFIQIYLNDMTGLMGISSKSEYLVILWLWKFSSFVEDEEITVGNMVNTSSGVRAKIIEKTGLKDGSIRNIISILVKKDLLLRTQYKSTYYLNPKYFFKGNLKQRVKSYNLSINYNIEELIDTENNIKLNFYSEK